MPVLLNIHVFRLLDFSDHLIWRILVRIDVDVVGNILESFLYLVTSFLDVVQCNWTSLFHSINDNWNSLLNFTDDDWYSLFNFFLSLSVSLLSKFFSFSITIIKNIINFFFFIILNLINFRDHLIQHHLGVNESWLDHFFSILGHDLDILFIVEGAMWIEIYFCNQKFDSLLVDILSHDVTNILNILCSYQSFTTLIVNLELLKIVFSLLFVVELATEDVGHLSWLYLTVVVFIT